MPDVLRVLAQRYGAVLENSRYNYGQQIYTFGFVTFSGVESFRKIVGECTRWIKSVGASKQHKDSKRWVVDVEVHS